jgi:protein tyrosine phosphatase
VDFEQRVFACLTTKPVVVHCTSGVGRTGMFIALHSVIKEAVETGYIDFYNTLVGLRKDRMNMIQTAEQYTFLHRAAEVALLCLETTISSKDIARRIQFLETRVLEMTRMEKEFNSICDVYINGKYDMGESESGDGRNMVYENSRAIVNKQKNRFSNILSNDRYRPHLNKGEKADDYINAVLVPSFTKACHQILTQLPLPTTITEFWRLVTQYKVSLIVAFEQDIKATDSTIGDYLPSGENEPFNNSMFHIQTKSPISGQFWLQQNLLITTNTLATNSEESALHKAEQHQVTHLKCTSTDLEPTQLLALAEKIKSHNSSDNGRTLFMCRNGATYSGLVYVLTLLLDKMDNDNHLTIPLVVGTVKAIRPQVIPTVEQYGLLYTALQYYCDPTSVYCKIEDSKPKP